METLPDPALIPSVHAEWRCARRNLAPAKIAYVLRYGVRLQRTGVTFVVLRRCDIPSADRRDDRCAKLEGTVLLVSGNGSVVTAYRNREALKQIRRKQKGRAATKRPARLEWGVLNFE